MSGCLSYIGEGVKIKAAGGVKTREDLEQFLEEGCERDWNQLSP